MRRWIALGMSLAVLLLAASHALVAEPQEPERLNRIYYLAGHAGGRGGDMIQASDEALDLPADAALEETASAMVKRLLAGPSDGSLRSPVPKSVRLRSLEIRGRRAYVDLSEEFSRLQGVELALADYCLTLTLTTLEGINAVAVTAQGHTVGQQPKQVFFERDVLLSTMDDVIQTVEVALYFPGEDGGLEEERRVLEVYEGQTLSELLVDALLAGPEDRDLQRVIPEDFVVNAIRVDSGICYINLPPASLATLPEDEETQRLIFRSLAESLYSLETVQSIRLLSDGEELTLFGQVPVEEYAQRG